MAKNRAQDVSLVTFGEKYFGVYKSGGTIEDLMNACEMVNLGSVRQKQVALKKWYKEQGHGELPSLARKGRVANSGKSVGAEAADNLAALFAADKAISGHTDKTESDAKDIKIKQLSEIVHQVADLMDDAEEMVDDVAEVSTELATA